MTADSRAILDQLSRVEHERSVRAGDPGLAAAVLRLKAFQRDRFARTYRDLLASPRYAAAARFFLEELYGPQDFSERDAQFARVVPALVRLFPDQIVDTVHTLARLHALSESLDTRMGHELRDRSVDGPAYVQAWQTTGQPEARESQIALTLAIGGALDRLTRKPLLRHSLHLMRGPARAAGLGALQQFLEAGFDTFKAMGGAEQFLACVGQRERELAAALFSAQGDGLPTALGQLP